MKRLLIVLPALCCLLFGVTAMGAPKDSKDKTPEPAAHAPPKAQKSVTEGSVTVEGKRIDYTATAGTIILKNKKGEPTGSMFYVAYAKRGADKNKRPVTFFYNGGPGSASVWLHMGAFGPRRVVTSDHTHTPAAPYKLMNNDYSLLDVTDEVFIDAMGTGYSRVIDKKHGGAGEDKDFYGVDADAQSFAQFINQYLSQNNRWNSPKYIYGESYGTTRSALLARVLQQGWDIDLNGVVLQSSILDFRTASFNAGNDLAYEMFLPSYAAVAWYHHKLANQPADLPSFLKEVQQFAIGPYSHALAQGSTLSQAQFDAIAKKVSEYTGLSVAYVEKAKLRVTASEFEHELLNADDTTVGRLDARFTGPSMNPMNQTPQYDPASSIMPAYIATFNAYVHNTLKFGRGHHYLPMAGHKWDWKHKNRTYGQTWPGLPNTAFDLASAMKHNPNLQVLVSSGYFDLATPYFATVYTMQHLPIPKSLDSHIHMKFYDSGHMIYAHAPALKQLHDNTVTFIEQTDAQ